MKHITKIISTIALMSLFSISYATSTNLLVQKKQNKFSIVVDNNFTAFTGASIIRSVGEGYKFVNDYSVTNNRDDVFVYLRRLGRVAVDTIPAIYLSTYQHEYFGHGARMREFDVPNRKYHVGFASGWASGKFNAVSAEKRSAIFAGGVEGQFVLARQINMDWLYTRKINVYDALSYSDNILIQFRYINTAFTTGHDFYLYLDSLKKSYGKKVLSYSTLQAYTLLDLLDPFNIWAPLAINNYVLTGRPSWRFPMFEIGKFEYLPGLRMILTPYGPEVQLVNYLSFKNSYGETIAGRILLNVGNTNRHASLSVGAEIGYIPINDQFGYGARFYLWNQPELLTGRFLSNVEPNLGIMISGTGYWQPYKNVVLSAELGFKTKGFVTGEPIKTSPVIKIGLSVFV